MTPEPSPDPAARASAALRARLARYRFQHANRAELNGLLYALDAAIAQLRAERDGLRELLRELDPEKRGTVFAWCPFCSEEASYTKAPRHTADCRLSAALAAGEGRA